MRTWTESACFVLAWSILSIIVVAAGMQSSVHQTQANTRTADSTDIIPTSTLSVAAEPVTATSHPTRYVVHDGDTLSGIAARFAVRGGWPALYAANRRVIGPDPDVIHVGTVLVLAGQSARVRYTVVTGDTLSSIAAEFAVRGGWPALYAANLRVIGAYPNDIRPGTVLTVPRPASPSPPAPRRAWRRHQRPPSPPAAPQSSSAGHRQHLLPVTKRAPVATGMPQWLKAMLLAAGLLIGAAFLAEPALAIRRRRQAATAHGGAAVGAGQPPGSGVAPAGSGQPPGSGRPAVPKTRIVLADYSRLVVTHSTCDDAVYVLRPPGQDPAAILRVARLVLPEGPYRQLAGQLGLPAEQECSGPKG